MFKVQQCNVCDNMYLNVIFIKQIFIIFNYICIYNPYAIFDE